jgi:dTDP-4-dehydrorhamnose reductase
MKTVCMLGRNGFIGRTVYKVLQQNFSMVEESEPCDVLVNCAGFSRMYEAEKNPAKMEQVEDLIFKRIEKVQFSHLIHLSTIYIESSPEHAYSKVKKKIENRIMSRWPKATILRLASVIGEGLQKNVLFDLVHGFPLWVTPDSVYNYISSKEVGNLLCWFVENPLAETINVGASESISVSEIVKMLGVTTSYGNEKNHILVDVSRLQEFYKVRTSKEYVEEFWREANG